MVCDKIIIRKLSWLKLFRENKNVNIQNQTTAEKCHIGTRPGGRGRLGRRRPAENIGLNFGNFKLKI